MGYKKDAMLSVYIMRGGSVITPYWRIGYYILQIYRQNQSQVFGFACKCSIRVEIIPSYFNDHMPNQEHSSLSINILKYAKRCVSWGEIADLRKYNSNN